MANHLHMSSPALAYTSASALAHRSCAHAARPAPLFLPAALRADTSPNGTQLGGHGLVTAVIPAVAQTSRRTRLRTTSPSRPCGAAPAAAAAPPRSTDGRRPNQSRAACRLLARPAGARSRPAPALRRAPAGSRGKWRAAHLPTTTRPQSAKSRRTTASPERCCLAAARERHRCPRQAREKPPRRRSRSNCCRHQQGRRPPQHGRC
mmetsp:Transcript_11905/g.38139  ORF Transcript_11905/g.38139 Transcript_11905/m.38139 type:complete len:206 (+) Transcript_11905:1136-1753(+)